MEVIVFCFFIIVSASFFIFGNIKSSNFDRLESIKNSYTIKAISPNISLDRFYTGDDELKIINELIELSAPTKKEPTLYLWPEGIIPDSHTGDMGVYKDLFMSSFGTHDLIIMGLNSINTKNDKNLLFNSMAIFNNKLDLINVYNKINLVPFGEFIPIKNILSLVGFKTVTNNYQSFSKGKTRTPINIINNKIDLNLLPLICYEIISSVRLSKDHNFDYIINISEDGWFGNSIGPKQHFAHSIFRSVESGKYIIRSANNGISAIINPLGIIEQEVKFGLTGYVELTETKLVKSSLFMLYGNKIFLMLILIYIFLIFSFNRHKHE